MFFILRCMFWLGLVFFNMDWSSGGPGRPAHVATLPDMHRVATAAGARARGFCAAHAQDCLGALIAASSALDHLSGGGTGPAGRPVQAHAAGAARARAGEG
jgi:hypothetical protein